MHTRSASVLLTATVLLLVMSAAFTNNSVSSQQLNVTDSAETLENEKLGAITVQIASLSTDYRAGNLREKEQIEDSIDILAKQRYEMLSKIIENDPEAVLRYALPEEVLNKLPEDRRAYFEKREEIEGELEVIAACEETDGRILYYVKSGNERLALYFTEQPDGELLTGAAVSVKGVRVGDSVAADNGKSENFEVSELVLPNTLGEQKILVLLVNFRNDVREPFTVGQADDVMFNNANSTSQTNYFRENSYGQTWLTGDVRGWFTLGMNATCDALSVAVKAKQAAQSAGINLSSYDKILYAYPRVSGGCGWTGTAYIGGSELWIQSDTFGTSFEHELGHSFGLYHSKRLDCGATVIGSNCTIFDRGNMVDRMGYAGATGHFYSYHKERLGWLNYGTSPAVITPTQNGTYSISPGSVQDSSPKAIKILKSSGTWYHIEFRRPTGFDSYLSYTYPNSNLTSGVVFSINDESDGNKNYMLDMTPETEAWADSALVAGRSYTDSAAGFTITTVSASSSGAVVNVTFSGQQPTCVLANPTVSLNPSETQWIGAGGSVSYSVTLSNNNSSSCTANDFNLQTVLPSGWNSDTNPPSMYIAPGATATADVQVNTTGSTGNGFYVAGITASNAANTNYFAAVNANMAVYNSLGVSVAPSSPTYNGRQLATLSVLVQANGVPMDGADITCTILKPDGRRVSDNAVSGADGTATFTYRFNRKKDPRGTYIVTVNANLNGISGNGSTSFILEK